MRSLYLIRHGKAVPRGSPPSDAERALTAGGVRDTTVAARGFARLACPSLILTSPLVRARQTAELFAQAIEPTPKVESLDELAAVGSPAGLLRIVDGRKADAIALVGHEPDMSRLVSCLLTGAQTLQTEFKKAAACRVDVDDTVSLGAGVLLWMIPPKVLRALGKQ